MNRFLTLALIPLFLTSLTPVAIAGDPAFERRRYYYEDIFLPFFKKDSVTGLYQENRPGATRGSFAMPKPKGVFRVFVIGGSIAQRYMSYDSEDFPDLLKTLRSALPSETIETLDCGMGGYDSFREAMILEEIVEYEPDLIILMSGHNENIGSPPIPLWLLHARDRLEKISAFKALITRLQKSRGHIDEAMPTGPRERDAQFENNLRGMLKLAKKKGIPIAVVVPPLNLKESPAKVRPPLADENFVRGWVASIQGRWKEAVTPLQESLKHPIGGNNLPNWTDYYLGLALLETGDKSKAKQHLLKALDAPRAQRCSSDCPDILRKTSREEGALLIELDKSFESASKDKIPGLEIFNDEVHWVANANGLASRAILDALKTAPAFSKLEWDDSRIGKWLPMEPLSDREILNTFRYAANMMMYSPFMEWTAVIYLHEAGKRMPIAVKSIRDFRKTVLEPKSGKGRAWSQNKLDIPKHKLAWYFGELELRRGRYKLALKYFDKALKSKETPPDAHVGRAVAAALSGKPKQALKSLKVLEKAGKGHYSRALHSALNL